MSVKRRGVGS